MRHTHYSCSFSFTLFEVLIAWSLFVSAYFILSVAQLNCLKRIQQTYFENRAVMRLINIDQLVHVLDPDAQSMYYQQWHNENKALFPLEQDNWSCVNQTCCFKLIWKNQRQWLRYCN